MLHTFAAGTWSIYQQQVQFLAHAHLHHFEYILGELEGLDPTARRIHLAPVEVEGERVAERRSLDYDVPILAFGSRANDFGTPGVLEHCHFIDNQAEADLFNQRVRALVARSFVQGGDIDIAIVGGCATGVELTAELTRMVELASSYGDGSIRQRLRLTLLEGSQRILGAFPEVISETATAQLRALGADVRSDVEVVGADEAGCIIDGGERIDAALKVWAAEIRAAALVVDIGNDSGGDDSGDWTPRLFTDRPVRSARLLMADASDAGRYFADEIRDINEALAATQSHDARAALTDARSFFSQQTAAIGEHRCDLSWVWREQRAWSPTNCNRLLSAGYAGGYSAGLARSALGSAVEGISYEQRSF